MENEEVSMERMCRSCMRDGGEMRSLFDSKKDQDTGTIELSKMIMACAAIQVSSDDGLPNTLCVSCEMKLTMAYEFKRQCEKSDKELRSLAKSNLSVNAKEEDTTDVISSPESETEEFKCPVCEKDFTSKKGLRMHISRSHGNDQAAPKVSEDDINKFECDCGLSFNKDTLLCKHQKECHNEVNVKQEMVEEDEIGESYLDQFVEKRPRQFECDICHKVLTTYVGMKIHKRRHTGVNLYACTMCVQTFTKGSHLKRHVRTKHGIDPNTVPLERTNVKKVMVCEFCDRKFKYKKSFNHHMKSEHGLEDNDDSDLPLSVYVNLVPTNEALEPTVEIRVHSEGTDEESQPDNPDLVMPEDVQAALKEPPARPIRSYVCHVCEVVFSRNNHLTRHMTLHKSVLVHKCDLCEKSFAATEFLDKHVQQEHINKPYTCSMCQRTFSRGEHLMRHLKIHLPDDKVSATTLVCSVCKKEFSRPDHLARHIKIHLQQDKRHVCTECGKAFNRLDNLKTHQRIHTGQKDTTKLHLCIYCGKEFNNSSNMIVHMRRHTGERPYKCKQCGKGFPRSHDLKCHERTHSGEKPYLCTLCGKSFNKSNKLLRHTRVHTGERPYVCNICGRAFTQSNDLALHMRRHTGSRPYACGVCPARFIQSGQLKTHRKATGHWMEIQPDLKGGHRVEPVASVTEPVPIKFKTHGMPKPDEEDEDDPHIDPQKEETQNTVPPPAIQLVTSSKILEYANANPNTIVLQPDDPRLKEMVSEDRLKMLSAAAMQTFQTFTPATSTFVNSESVNYQTYEGV